MHKLNGDVWKFISTGLLALTAFFAGGFVGDVLVGAEVIKVEETLDRHVGSEIGHPVTNARIIALEKQLDRIESKLDLLMEK